LGRAKSVVSATDAASARCRDALIEDMAARIPLVKKSTKELKGENFEHTLWSVRLVLVPNNSMRLELRDLARIVLCIKLLADHKALERSHIGMFYDWWEIFVEWLIIFFAAEESSLYPGLEKHVLMEDELNSERRLEMRKKIQKIVEVIDESRSRKLIF